MVKKKTKKNSMKNQRSKKQKEVKNKKVIRKNKNPLSYFAPRILLIIYIGLITAFSIRNIETTSIKTIILTLLIYLIPSTILLIFLIISWTYESLGGYLLISLGVIFGLFFGGFENLTGFCFMVLPIWTIGILFLVSKKLS